MTAARTYAMHLLDGRWPADIRGHHWINGPGQRLPWHQHSIFAPGVLQRFDLEPAADGELRWHVRDTHAYDVQAALAHLDVFRDPRAFHLLGGPVFTGVNNSFFLIDDRVFLTADFNRPWEIDPEQPRVKDADAGARFRHYVNLERTAARLQLLLKDFRWDRLDRVVFGLT